MPRSRPRFSVTFVPALLLCLAAQALWAQVPVPEAEQPEASPFRPLSGSRFRDNRERGLSESARRFGREHQGAIILGIEPVMVQGRSLNRIKSLDAQGRVVIWVDDPMQPRAPLRRADENNRW